MTVALISARRANHLRARNPVQPLRKKYSALFLTQISCVLRASRPTRGALRTSRNARWDAMDAEFAKDDRKRLRTAKSCGPDAPMAGVKFARSSRFLRATVTNKLWSRRGEHGISRKPLRREGRSVSAEPVCSCAFFYLPLHMRLRVQRAPGLPCALFILGANDFAKLGRNAVARMRRCVW